MSFEAQLKETYAQAHKRLVNGTVPKQPIVGLQHKPTIRPITPSEPPTSKIAVIPNSSPVILEPPKPRYTLPMLAEWLSGMELVGVADIRSKQRTKEIALPRMIFYHLAYKHSSGRFSSTQIGRYTKKDHTTVLTGIKTIARRRQTDKQLNFRLEQYEKALVHQSIEVRGKSLCVLCPYQKSRRR